MNEHRLPDDISRWPGSPFELLGVQPGVSERDLRRAYAQLIRTFKPERFPEHFRRIREAYEEVRSYIQYFTVHDAVAEPRDGATERPPTEAARTPSEAGDATAPSADRPTLRSFDDELDEAWIWAVDGDGARAYAQLLDLQSRYPQRSETYVRLYALLGAAPEIDDRRIPCDFLVQGLRQSGGSGPCHELYRREIEDHPEEALTERFEGLLEAIAQPGLLAASAHWRWTAAAMRKRFDVIGDDLPQLRPRLVGEDDEIWLRLLTAAADQLAWSPAPADRAVFAKCLREAAEFEHLQLRCPDIFDRLELLEQTVVAWHALMRRRSVPPDFLELLRDFWTRPFARIRPRVTAQLAAVADKTAMWLAHFDKVHAASPHLLSLFGRVLDSYQWTLNLDEDSRDDMELVAVARRFLEAHMRDRYVKLRPKLLAFCLREMVPPEVVAQAALIQVVVLPEKRVQKLANDWPLRHVYRACFLFRN